MGNKIRGEDCTVKGLLSESKFSIEYFQREYRWEEKHIKALIDDLTDNFLRCHQRGIQRNKVSGYDNYYLGPVVFNDHNGANSIIDGQQRITSLTLLLIYLKHKTGGKANVDSLIFSETFGEKTFNINSSDREVCLKSLFEKGKYDVKEGDNETVKNIAERYEDIEEYFPDDRIEKEDLLYFVDWLTEKVVLIKITAETERDGYIIFETMNDRGLNLTQTEMLKGFVLSKISDPTQKGEIDNIWKKQIEELHKINKNADTAFFQSWFRAKYASSIRKSGRDTVDEDFELIGSQFHRWFKDQHKDRFNLDPSDFYNFFKNEFTFFVKYYLLLSRVQDGGRTPHLYYIKYWGIAESLRHPLLLSAINPGDDEVEILQKLDAVAKFVERFAVRRSLNHKKFGPDGIKNTFFNYIQDVRKRSKNWAQLEKFLREKENDPNQGIKWNGAREFTLHAQNKRFVKHLLSRISSHADNLNGGTLTYSQFHHPYGKQFEIEHILKNKFDEYREEYDDKEDFDKYRNKIGALLLLPKGTNQSYGGSSYQNKLDHYVKENAYVQTLNKKFYYKNPNFTKNEKVKALNFKPHGKFGKEEIDKRTGVVIKICKQLWGGI